MIDTATPPAEPKPAAAPARDGVQQEELRSAKPPERQLWPWSGASVPWTRVFAEFVVIFAGVTLSLAADDWRGGRADRETERTILAHISADLVRDSVEIALTSRRMALWDSASVWLNRNAGRRDVPEDSLVGALKTISRMYFYRPVQSAYFGYRDSGQLRLISDDSLRRSIVDYYEVDQAKVGEFYALALDHWRGWLPVLSRHVDFIVPEEGNTMWARLNNVKLLSPVNFVTTDPQVGDYVDLGGIIGGNAVEQFDPVLRTNSELRERARRASRTDHN